MRVDLAQEPQGVSFVSPFLVLAGECEARSPWMWASSLRPETRWASARQATQSGWKTV